ncbi:MAG: hypothetical protein N4A62_21120 [Marinisporobacter sp.]|jgi:hypothetical protein|nr:hypothetical protein [Marinisporobacter sp.]
MDLYYRFEKRKGIFNDAVLSNIHLVLNSFKRKNVVKDIVIDKSKIKFSSDEFEEFYLTPSNIKRKQLNCDGDYGLVCCLVILILKKHYEADFKFTADCFLNKTTDDIWFKAIKYVNKMLQARIKIKNNQFIF